jgi:hypothetical protein
MRKTRGKSQLHKACQIREIAFEVKQTWSKFEGESVLDLVINIVLQRSGVEFRIV